MKTLEGFPMHEDVAAAIRSWFLLYLPGLPWLVCLWRLRQQKNQEGDLIFSENAWLNVFVGLVVVLSSWWFAGTALCLPGIVYEFAYPCDFGSALVYGGITGAAIVVVGRVAFLGWDSTRDARSKLDHE